MVAIKNPLNRSGIFPQSTVLTLTLREEHRLKVFVNRVLRTEERRRDRGWSKMCDEVLMLFPKYRMFKSQDEMGQASLKV
jgi:hypothetical protein